MHHNIVERERAKVNPELMNPELINPELMNPEPVNGFRFSLYEPYQQ